MRAIPLFLISFLLLACSGGGIGGAPVGSGGAVGDNSVGGTLGGSGSAAQPLDAGFSGPSKDVNGLNYVLREAKGRVLCKESNGDYRVKFSGQVFNDKTEMGVAGYLRISDFTAQRYQVTRAGFEPEIGNFSTVMRLRAPFDFGFAKLVTSDEYSNLDVLLPATGGILQAVIAEPTTPVNLEETDFPCVEAAQESDRQYQADPHYDFQVNTND